MGLKDIFSSLKAMSTNTTPKPKKKSSTPSTDLAPAQANGQQRSTYKQQKDVARTQRLLETHSKHVNKIIKENEIKTSPSFDMSYQQQHEQQSGVDGYNARRCKIRTNPWIRSPTFHSIQFAPDTAQQQQLHNTSASSSSGVSSISQCCGESTSSSMSSTKSKDKLFILDDYSFKCEQTLELVELNSIFDNILLNNEDFVVSSASSSMSAFEMDRNNNNLEQETFRNVTDNDNNDDEEDEIELDKCVYELYKQIEILKEQKRLLDQKVNISKQLRI
jgi:hypothetical protein